MSFYRKIGKWAKYCHMRSDPVLSPTLAETEPLDEQSFWNFLDRYKKVILKPVSGARGAGILVVTKVADHCYAVKIRKKRYWMKSRKRLYSFIKAIAKRRPYLVQRFVYFARLDNRLFDLRIMVQRDKNFAWTVTGRLAKLAYYGYSVTNPEKKVLSVASVLNRSAVNTCSPDGLIEQIDSLALRAADRLAEPYPKLSIIGFDIGVDVEGKIWLIEANFLPAIYWFKQLPEQSAYAAIIAHKKLSFPRSPQQNQISLPNDEEFYFYH